MGNVFAECRRCSIEQCELCAEVLPRRPRDQQQGSGTGAPNSSSQTGGPRQTPGSPPWLEGAENSTGIAFRLHRDFQPSTMSDAEAFRLAQQMSLAGAGQRTPGLGEDIGDPDGLQHLVDDGTDPAMLHAAIMASHQHAPAAMREPRRQTEEEMMAQAIRTANLEEEARTRARLREEQNSEYEESLRIDRQRKEERALKERQEEERRTAEKEAKVKAELEEKSRRDHIATLTDEARARLKEEPPQEEKGRVIVKVGTPQGKALKRAFRCDDPVSQIYDYIVAEGEQQELVSRKFRLFQNMPRATYEDRNATLQAAGLQGQCALLVQVLDSDDEEEKDLEKRKPDQTCVVESTASQVHTQEVLETPAHIHDVAPIGTEPAVPEKTPLPTTSASSSISNAPVEVVAPSEMPVQTFIQEPAPHQTPTGPCMVPEPVSATETAQQVPTPALEKTIGETLAQVQSAKEPRAQAEGE